MYFKDCKEVNIEEFLNKKYTFYAHTYDEKDKSNNKEKETLKEHTDRTLFYFKLIVKNKKLYKVFLKLEKVFLDECSEKAKTLFREMLLNTIAFHDIGKLNPQFQNKHMKNKIIKENMLLTRYTNIIQAKHSILSSTVYLRYYYNYVNTECGDLSKEEKDIIRMFMVLNSYIISRHHSTLSNFDDYINEIAHKEESKIIKLDKVLRNAEIDLFNCDNFILSPKKLKILKESTNRVLENLNKEKSIVLYTYERLMFSLLVSSDYYATSEYKSDVKITSFGEINAIDEFYDIYKNTEISKSIGKYEQGEFHNSENKTFENISDINILRNEIFIESEKNLISNKDENVYFLEAPTGSGKTNIAMNLSFKSIEMNDDLNKIFYIYPFNTLVEQNVKNLHDTFGNNKKVYDKIAVVNSITPIKISGDDECEPTDSDYQKFLLDRQFLNYPIILTTHVSLFNTMFGASREACFGFYQLANSVIVLDEIQSYKNSIWTEIITFLNNFADILNIKIIIMSATLPNLNKLLGKDVHTTALIKNRDAYFLSPVFRDRVKMSYELLNNEFDEDVLLNHVVQNMKLKKKILIEFITKKSAYSFFNELKEKVLSDSLNDGYDNSEMDDNNVPLIELMTGDDNMAERNRILKQIKSSKAAKDGIVLVATQVIEAGVDIDMDIGYKDISILDSEEQFMGRINRSCRRSGIVYFFNLDNNNVIYKDDYRSNKEFSLLMEEIKEILSSKNYADYYERIMSLLKRRNSELNQNNIDSFFINTVGKLRSQEIEDRMKLIKDDDWSMSIYLCSKIKLEDGGVIDGEEVWNEYKKLLCDNDTDYAKNQVQLSQVKSKMNYFIYQIRCNQRPCYNDMIGDIYCIFDGEEYFKDGKLDREKFTSNIGDFF